MPVQYNARPVDCSWTIDGGKIWLQLVTPVKKDHMKSVSSFRVNVVFSSLVNTFKNVVAQERIQLRYDNQ